MNPPVARYSTSADNRALVSAGGGDVIWTAHARYVDGQIFNPATNRMDQVRLRAYQGDSTNPTVPFVSPTVSLLPGNTFRFEIVNELPADDPSCGDTNDVNVPHCFNSTNMHTHGLWISPTGNSDNVLLRIPPETRFTYEYNIPNDHPAGTFWYHPHLHGSTALQVSSGMAGALIIKGERLPTPNQTGDVDTLLRDGTGQPFNDRVILLQQIQYACRDANGIIKTNANGLWICDAGDIGRIESYDQFGPGSWPRSGRYTTINGVVLPVFDDALAGQPERWRLIHAGVRDSINLQFRKLTTDTLPEMTARTQEDFTALVDEDCAPNPIDQFSLATDGLTRAALRNQGEAVLHPGYREDLLIVFPEPGLYCVVDDQAPGNETVSAENKSRKLLGYVRVGAGPIPVVDPSAHLQKILIASARQHMPIDVSDAVVDDLRNGLKLSRFEPHVSLVDAQSHATRRLGFNIDLAGGAVFEIGEFDDAGSLTNAAPYDPSRIDRNLPLGAVEDWELRSFFDGHPFHIHVNPFQVIEILDAEGNDVSGHDPDNNSIYAGLKGVWKDTIFVTRQIVDGQQVPYRIRVRTHYRRYVGDFVLHCHILDHEDRGMMQNVRIGLPDGKGGLLSAHH